MSGKDEESKNLLFREFVDSTPSNFRGFFGRLCSLANDGVALAFLNLTKLCFLIFVKLCFNTAIFKLHFTSTKTFKFGFFKLFSLKSTLKGISKNHLNES